MVVTRRRQTKSVTNTEHEENIAVVDSKTKTKSSDLPSGKKPPAGRSTIKGKKERNGGTGETDSKSPAIQVKEKASRRKPSSGQDAKTEATKNGSIGNSSAKEENKSIQDLEETTTYHASQCGTTTNNEVNNQQKVKELKQDFDENSSNSSTHDGSQTSQVQLSEYSSDEENEIGPKTKKTKTIHLKEVKETQNITKNKKQKKIHNEKFSCSKLSEHDSTEYDADTKKNSKNNLSRRSSRNRTKVKYVDSESDDESDKGNPKKNMAPRRKYSDLSESCSEVSEKELESESASESGSDSSLSSEVPEIKRQKMAKKTRPNIANRNSKQFHANKRYKKDPPSRRVDLCEMNFENVSEVSEKLKQKQFDGVIRYFLGADRKNVVISPDLLKKKEEKSNSSKVTSVSVCSKPTTSKTKEKENESSSESEWEEVSDIGEPLDLENYHPEIPKEGIEISIGIPDKRRERRKKRQNEFANYARQYLNRFKKDTQVAMHKVHLLGYVAHILYINNLLLNDLLQGLFLSFIPDDFQGITTKKTTSILLTKMVTWFRNTFTLEPKETNLSLTENLLNCLQTKVVTSKESYCYLFVVLGRTMKLDVRLCKTLYPITFKTKDLIPTERQKRKSVDVKADKVNKNTSKSETTSSKPKTQSKKRNSIEQNDLSKPSTSKDVEKESASKSDSDSYHPKPKPTKTSSKTKIKVKNSNSSSSSKRKSRKGSKEEENNDEEPTARRGKREMKKNVSYKEQDNDDSESNSDEDFEPEVPLAAKHSTGSSSASKRNRKVLSSDSETDEVKASGKPCIDNWAEVFLNSEKKWVCVDVVQNIINRPYEIEANVSHQISYVIGVDNDFKVKDLTQRYASNWLTHVRKMRVDSEWWEESLAPFAPAPTMREQAENKQLEDMLMNKPMPTVIGEFKNHPLYVLKRHLLKYEALYPPDIPPLGFIRKEPVYARECVRILHSRESWKREGRAVKLGEEPYKMVKARPRWDKVNKKIYIPEEPLDVYGEWQTELWVSPPCKDGKVPRNEYGNVELFKQSMLPAGAVHLQLPGLNRIARKLGIDCAPAMVGFDGSASVGVIPVFDGFVACEEYEDVLIAAWNEEQVNIANREKEKYEKRVYGNWRKLIRGLLIREKIKSKYFGSDQYAPKDEQSSS